MSGLPDTGRHEPDQAARRAVLTRENSTVRQRQAAPGKDPIPLLKRVPQVRILPGAPALTCIGASSSPSEVIFRGAASCLVGTSWGRAVCAECVLGPRAVTCGPAVRRTPAQRGRAPHPGGPTGAEPGDPLTGSVLGTVRPSEAPSGCLATLGVAVWSAIGRRRNPHRRCGVELGPLCRSDAAIWRAEG